MRKVKELTLPDFKTYFNATVIKIMWHWHKEREVTEYREEKQQMFQNLQQPRHESNLNVH